MERCYSIALPGQGWRLRGWYGIICTTLWRVMMQMNILSRVKIWIFRSLTVVALMAGLCLIEFQSSYFPVALRNLVTDPLMSLVPEVEEKTVLVTVNDKDVERFWQWPWPRDIMGRTVNVLGEAGAGAIG